MLTDSQKSAARWQGASEHEKRRSHLRRLRTQLIELRGNQGEVSATDYDTLQQAGRVLDRVLSKIETDITDAKRIKREFDRRIADASNALATLPIDSVADVIALGEIDHIIGNPAWLQEDVEQSGWNYVANHLKRESLSGLAICCASEGTAPAEYVARIRDRMPDAAAKHAGLIQKITTIAIAEKLEMANRGDTR